MQAIKPKTNRLLYKLSYFAILIILGDFLLGQGLRYWYFKQGSGLLYRTTYAMEHTNSDVLIFGSSRANHHYHPEVLEKELGLSTYNTGRDGNFILYNTAVLKSTLKRYTPRIIVLDLDIFAFTQSSENYDRLSSLLPYYRTHEEIRDIVDLRGPFEKIKLASSVYPFNSMLINIAIGNTDMNKKRKSDQQGYVPLTTVYTKAIQERAITEQVDTQLVNCFSGFLAAARAAGSQVYVVASPVYYQYPASRSLQLARDICRKQDIPFWDYSLDTSFRQPGTRLFADPAHLNDPGARQFSQVIAARIKALQP